MAVVIPTQLLNKEPMDFNLPASLSNNFFDDIIVIHMSYMA